MNNIEKAKENYLLREENLSDFATKSSDAIRVKENIDDFRTPYFRDIDRIIHSLSYTRYVDKTQVYSFKNNDHISKRITHVQLVSKIARTIGRALLLNEDLIEAIALGHDIGHTPLGHTGEAILNEISLRELGEYFAHNVQGVREFMYVDNDGEGHNLTIQTLDGIFSHNGEILNSKYVPMPKTKEEFMHEYEESYKDLKKSMKYSPMTLEGCVMRISDIIGYIGRDIEDAINLGKLKREDIPKNIVEVLGSDNKEIVNAIIVDIINESMGMPYIKMSDKVFTAINDLKNFNYKEIYSKSMTKDEYNYYKLGMETIYKVYLDALDNKDYNNIIYRVFLNNQSDEYNNNNSNKRKVIDFISGMTDELFLKQVKKYTK